MNVTPIAAFTIEETLCETPLHVSRARRQNDGQAALLYEFRGARLSSAELAKWQGEPGATILALENTANGVVMALADGGTPLCAWDQVFSTTTFLPLALQLMEDLGRAHDDSGFYRHLNSSVVFLSHHAAHLAAPPVAALIFAQMQARGDAGDLAAQLWTLRFMAPEQTGRMNRTPDTRADLYALGVVFYQMLTGRAPFENSNALELVHSHLAKTPTAPHEINAEVPPALSSIVLKLLAKTPEERYQGIFGLCEDLRECQARWQSTGGIEAFELGRRDVSERLQVPAQLYGREMELTVLNKAFERTQNNGEALLLLVGGYSGVGKTVLAQALQPTMTGAGGYFLAGKIDQFRRNLPYASITEAFQSFVRQLQTESESRIAQWRDELKSALGGNGQVIADVIPEIELIIGPQPPVPVLGPNEALSRFNAVFQAFIGVLARRGQPLVLFLDDLQWMDSASLKLMESLVGSARNLLIIGAFRDNEVSASHPLTATAERLKAEKADCVQHLELTALTQESVAQLLADTLHSDLDAVRELSHLLVTKTDGNAFFLIQFLQTLHTDGLLSFDRAQGRWTWEARRIQQAGISGDVVELMAGKIRKMSSATREILPMAACLGNRFSLDALALVRGQEREATLSDLREALDTGLLLPAIELATEGELQTLRFLHDRVQQAAYSLLSEKEKSALHERAGRLFAAQARAAGEDVFEERLFDITNHLNNGSAQLKDDAARLELAQMNWRAALKAKNALAYDSALRYAAAGIDILPEAAPQTLVFELHFERSENELLLGDLNTLQTRFEVLFALATTLIEKARAYDLKVLYFTTRTMLLEANETGLEGLRLLGFFVPEKLTKATIVQEIARVKWIQGRRSTKDLLDLPQITDPERLAMLKLFSDVIVVAFQSDANLFAVLILRLTALSMQIGNSPIAPMGYGCYGIILCAPLGQYRAGYEFGQLAMELSRRSGDKSSFARASLIFGGFLSPWRAPLIEARTILREGYVAGAEAGDNIYANYDGLHTIFQRVFHGDSLDDIYRENEQYLDFVRRTSFKDGIENVMLYRQFVLCLQGKTLARGSFSDPDHDDEAHERAMVHYVNLTPKFHTVLKMESCCFLDMPREALRHAQRILQHPDKVDPLSSLLFAASFHLYHSMAQAMLYPRATTRQKRSYRFSLEVNHRRFKTWAKNCPQNFAHLEALLGAELARLRDDVNSAQTLYEKAISLAEKNSFPSHGALAHERAGTMNLMNLARVARESSRVLAQHHLNAARAAYENWGATEKVRLLDEKYGALLQTVPAPLAMAAPGASVIAPVLENIVSATLDVSTVIKAAQAISGEIDLGRLLQQLLRFALENAGATRGALVLRQDDRLLVEALGAVGEGEVSLPSVLLEECDELPLSLIQYVARTRESVVLTDATREGLFTGDAYIAKRQMKSVLCAPIVHQTKLNGLIYLENHLTPGAFTPERLEVLSVLSAQAAISLQNARLYGQLEEYSHTLQQRVAERTQELSAKNEQSEQTLRELREMQNRIIVQEKMASLGALTAGIAHEIKNPLNFVNNFAALSVDSVDELKLELEKLPAALDDETRDYLNEILNDLQSNAQKIKEHGTRADNIVRGMLLHSRGQSSEPEVADLNTLVREAVHLTYHGQRAHDPNFNITLEEEYDDSVGAMRVLPHEISRVILNLAGNACYATTQKSRRLKAEKNGNGHQFSPTLRVVTQVVGSSVQIRLRDNGDGIAEESRQKIFTPFFTTKPTGEGTGLGLSLSYDIVVQQHSGEMRFESQTGEWTEFVVILPLKRAP